MDIGLHPCFLRRKVAVTRREAIAGYRAHFGNSYDAGHFERIHSVLCVAAGPSRPVESEGLGQLRVKQESKLL